MKTKKQIGGAGYVGTFAVVVFKNEDRKFIEMDEDTTHEDLGYLAEDYSNVKQVEFYVKSDGNFSAQQKHCYYVK